MIEEIRIRNLGVIAETVVELANGLNVLTGETGAGKTMVVTSLGLLLGGKSDAGAVRHGSDRADVEGRYAGIAGVPEVAERIAEAGGELDDGSLIVARSIAAAGRSRAFAGGRSVPAQTLADLGERLVAIHGQHDQQRLLRPSEQREVLDRFAGPDLAELLAEYRKLFAEVRAAEKELAEIIAHARERAQQADVLRFGLEEIEAVSPQPGEDAELAAEASRLTHAVSLRESAEGAGELLAADAAGQSDIDVLTLMARARRLLDQAAQLDPALADIATRLAEAAMLTGEVASELAGYATSLETDPGRLAMVEDRRAALNTLMRKYGETIDDVLEWERRAAARLAGLTGDDQRIDALRAETASGRARLAELASAITDRRTDAGQRLGRAIEAELRALAMPGARVSFRITDLEAPGPHGKDEVELLLAANSSSPQRPIGQAASGGELSRIMLAVEVVLAELDPVPTMIFDEVDAGVGGATAVEIGRRLQRLGTHTQVIVVTHLPQVAAFADHHVVVRKGQTEHGTVSEVRAVAGAERVTELSRMMAGQEGSASAAAHAEELLDIAAVGRATG